MSATSFRAFIFLLICQSFSIFGTTISVYALGVWIYSEVGTVTIYTIIALANFIPIILLSPFAGALVDKLNRKKIMMAAQVVAAAITATLMFLYSIDALEPWHIIVSAALSASVNVFVLPAITATVPLMVPKHNLNQANGMISLAAGVIQLASPAISGAIYVSFGMKTIFAIDLTTFAIGILALAITRIPQPSKTHDDGHTELIHEPIMEALGTAWETIRDNPSLRQVIFSYSFFMSCVLLIGIMVQPMVLAFTDAKMLGTMLTVSGFGMLYGSALMIFSSKQLSIFYIICLLCFIALGMFFPEDTAILLGDKSPRINLLVIIFFIVFGYRFVSATKNSEKHIPVILLSTLCVGIFSILTPMTKNPWLLCAGGFIIMSCFPLYEANNRSLIQRKIEPQMLGRIIGLRNFILGMTNCLLLAVSGPITDYLFEPAMMDDGMLASTLGQIYDTGKGRGTALMISVMGVFALCIGFFTISSKPLREADTLLEDKVQDVGEDYSPISLS